MLHTGSLFREKMGVGTKAPDPRWPPALQGLQGLQGAVVTPLPIDLRMRMRRA